MNNLGNKQPHHFPEKNIENHNDISYAESLPYEKGSLPKKYSSVYIKAAHGDAPIGDLDEKCTKLGQKMIEMKITFPIVGRKAISKILSRLLQDESRLTKSDVENLLNKLPQSKVKNSCCLPCINPYKQEPFVGKFNDLFKLCTAFLNKKNEPKISIQTTQFRR